MSDDSLGPVKGLSWIGHKIESLNNGFRDSVFGRFFHVTERRTSLSDELRAGLVCFLTVCYIIPVNSGILADSGGSCEPSRDCNPERYAKMGDSCKFDDAVTNPEWAQCVFELKQHLISATCIAAMIGTCGMALIANMPMAVAPAMGVNAYFTYTVVGFMGTGQISYQAALAAAFVEGWIFIILSITGMRGFLMELIPRNLLFATATGIGCFLAFIGFQKTEGLGVIGYDGATLVTLAGCPPDERMHTYAMRDWDQYWHDFCWDAWRDGTTSSMLDCGTCATAYNYFINERGLTLPINPSEACRTYVMSFSPDDNIAPDIQLGLPARSSSYGCAGKKLQAPTMWLGIFGGMLMVLLMIRGVNAAILVGILFITFISWIPTESNKATYFTDHSEIPGGEARYQYFLKGATVPSVARTGGELDFKALGVGDTWIALITFLYLDFMDATSTMYAMASLINDGLPGFLDSKGSWPRQMWTMVVDGASIVVGSTLGTSPLTVFAESGVGIREGGRTGLTALVVAVGFGISMFLAPIFASIPPYATGPAVILVGALMFEHARHIDWLNIKSAVPAFLTIILMPLTYSIAYGIIGGILTQFFLWLCCFVMDSFESLVLKRKPYRHVWLYTMSAFYCALGKEQVLFDELPDYIAEDMGMRGDHSANPAHVAFPEDPKMHHLGHLEEAGIPQAMHAVPHSNASATAVAIAIAAAEDAAEDDSSGSSFKKGA